MRWGPWSRPTAASLPFALVHGEPLVACAAWALGEAGVFLVDLGTGWEAHRGRRCAVRAARRAVPADAAGVPGRVRRPRRRTVRGDGRASARSPTPSRSCTTAWSAPPSTAARCSRWSHRSCCRPRSWPRSTACRPPTSRRSWPTLAERFPVETLEAPAEARRVADEVDLRVLEALTAPPVSAPEPADRRVGAQRRQPRHVVLAHPQPSGRRAGCRRRPGRSSAGRSRSPGAHHGGRTVPPAGNGCRTLNTT